MQDIIYIHLTLSVLHNTVFSPTGSNS